MKLCDPCGARSVLLSVSITRIGRPPPLAGVGPYRRRHRHICSHCSVARPRPERRSMTERPAPPLTIEMDRTVLATVRRDPALFAALNAVLLRATGRLRALLAEDRRAVRVAAQRENLTVEVTFRPADVCVVTEVHRGGAG